MNKKECVKAHPLKDDWRACAYLGLDYKCDAPEEQYKYCKGDLK